MKRKIFFFDIDGTLLDQEKQISLKTREAIRLLKKAGHQVLIATGRAPFMFKEILCFLFCLSSGVSHW